MEENDAQGSKLKKMSGHKFATSYEKFGHNFENVSREINWGHLIEK